MSAAVTAPPAFDEAVLKALAEPLRARIVALLADEELCVCHLVEELGVVQPLVSHHLRVLRHAGVVEAERYKAWTYYRLRPDSLKAIAQTAAALSRQAKSAAPGRRRRPCG